MRPRHRSHRAFTLIELTVVMAIIAISVAVVVPYSMRSQQALKTEQVCQDVVGALRWALDRAVRTRKPVRFLLDVRGRCYCLETTATADGSTAFRPIEGFFGDVRPLGKDLVITDVRGFEAADDGAYGLVFDPGRPWPQAMIDLCVDSDRDNARTLWVRGRDIRMEASGD